MSIPHFLKIKGVIAFLRIGFVTLLAMGIQQPQCALAADAVPLRWITTHDVAQRLIPELDFETGPTLTPVPSDLDLKAPPLVMLAGVALLPAVANALVAAYRNLVYGGLVIEVKDGELLIRSDRRLPYGTVVITDDSVTVHRIDELPDSSALVGPLTEVWDRAKK